MKDDFFEKLIKEKYVLKRILFPENLQSIFFENESDIPMNELISLNRIVIRKNDEIHTEIEVLYSLLRVSTFSEHQNYEKEISKEEAKNLLRLSKNEQSFLNEVYNLLKIKWKNNENEKH